MSTKPVTLPDPFLLRFAKRRSSTGEMPGRYSSQARLWVVDSPEGERPIVQSGIANLSDTQTKTMADLESDDDDRGRGVAMETSTLTKVRQEADDQDAMVGLPELQTKTEVEHERDDEDVSVL